MSGRQRQSSTMSRKKVDVSFTGIREPKFLQKLRATHGLKPREEQQEEDIQAKFAKLPKATDDDDSFHVKVEDEPQVVVLKDGDLTMQEAKAAVASGAKGTEAVLAAHDQPKFAKKKRDKTHKEVKDGSKRSKSLNKKNASTLSFQDDDEED
ncbi:uncharacterized protein MONBRDRAFT_34621 [Monosiga brevicollis MX1]|uniref:DUF4604 domain-containing protein n=1 Tax=Monosiga brevicollis TaxID=81824 RepID=A9VCY0_MONBE|nr:uncharacterized protein MONBRDRAFT_34621 [Monosiga brevicollis MX1]EDQ84580.1 predicted protein [Monosiga brevicollis MX1]|eukprot:XP_001750607.1 hypothetical protein [Monosiga brevicollis MX1]